MDKFIAHILVVDDDEGIRSLVKKYLNENNYIVTTAANAEEAIEKIEVIEFDLIKNQYLNKKPFQTLPYHLFILYYIFTL